MAKTLSLVNDFELREEILESFQHGSIGHFRDVASLCFKTRPSAKPFLCKLFFIIMQKKKTHFHRKGFPLGLFLRMRVFGTRK